MMRSWIRAGIATGLLTASGLPAETLHEKDGIALEGSVRMAGRSAAISQVLAESESAEAYEQNKAHHGRPLRLWRSTCSNSFRIHTSKYPRSAAFTASSTSPKVVGEQFQPPTTTRRLHGGAAFRELPDASLPAPRHPRA